MTGSWRFEIYQNLFLEFFLSSTVMYQNWFSDFLELPNTDHQLHEDIEILQEGDSAF